MNKQDAQNEINALKECMAELEKIINAPEMPENPVFVTKIASEYCWIDGIGAPSRRVQTNAAGSSRSGFVSFRTQWVAFEFLDAFQVMLELRAQPGVVPYRPVGNLWTLDLLNRSGIGVGSLDRYSPFAPVFDSAQSAQNAVNAVGEKRILQAVKTLAWCV